MIAIQKRPSVALIALLELALIVFSYLFTFAVGIACAVLPFIGAAYLGGISAVLLIVLGLIMSGTILSSLIPRRDKQQIKGVPIILGQHPRLASLIEAIAAQLGETVPSFVYLVPDPNAFVTERGDVLGLGGRRLMGLGLPLMAAMTVSEFRAVLAHEFAHFYSGDTRLGPRVYRVRAAMSRTIRNLASDSDVIRVLTRFAIAALAYTVVVQGLIAYWKLFLRVTQHIARQQEYRADELACYVAGGDAMASGLQKVVRITSLSPSFWGSVISPIVQMGYRPPLADGLIRYYNSPLVQTLTANALSKRIANEKTSAYDTHPPMKLRLERVAALRTKLSCSEDPRPALSLLDNVEAIEKELLEAILPESKHPLKPVDWEHAGSVVWIPCWQNFVEEHARILAGQKMETLPELAHDLSKIAGQMRDPPGILLTREQRSERAAKLLTAALTLALIENGWNLNVQPGDFQLSRGEERLTPGNIVITLRGGKLNAKQWRDWCGSHNLPVESALLARKVAL